MAHWSHTTPSYLIDDEEDDAELLDALADQLQSAIDLGEDVAAYAAAVPAGAVLQSRYARHLQALVDQLERVLHS